MAKPFSFISLSNVLGYTSHEKEYLLSQEVNYNTVSLSEMFDSDQNIVNDILKTFVEETSTDIEQLKKTIEDKDVEVAQSICHKMLPMFAQIGSLKAVEVLTKIDVNKTKDVKTYSQWENDVIEVIQLAEKLVEGIKKKMMGFV